MAKSILIITSSLAEQVRLLLLLSATGYIPTCCDSLSSALTALEASKFDAIVAESIIEDTPPQKMTAVEFMSILQETTYNAATPVIVMGEVLSLGYIMNTLRSGAARFIPAPFTSTEFLQTISAELDLSRYCKI
ncbi:DNA-binding transcriptional response regulator [Halodesulfovibrio marinisediminis]|uniref:Response regulatory domain-containing protein n=1 Tax=Halodesulfovibrio marinisediminis DSM 17456 TaxID=1121457 RepID=A0A1N6J2C8_9BACT|nr:hypothetical protein [Halodesulfovibrio marinisediminis]SIO38276.1 hypothetical protein SAMN02745161_3078 [Halodesulfovibrio marinisediminis DSM 17456]